MSKYYKQVRVVINIETVDKDAVQFLRDTIQTQMALAGWFLHKEDIVVEVPVNA